VQNFRGTGTKNKSELFSAKDEHNNTALYYAVGGGHHESVALLLSSGVDVNIKNEDGNT
jgi:ankyrin repeat protein